MPSSSYPTYPKRLPSYRNTHLTHITPNIYNLMTLKLNTPFPYAAPTGSAPPPPPRLNPLQPFPLRMLPEEGDQRKPTVSDAPEDSEVSYEEELEAFRYLSSKSSKVDVKVQYLLHL